MDQGMDSSSGAKAKGLEEETTGHLNTAAGCRS